MRISHSLIEAFKQCPYRYKLLAIDKLTEPKSQEAVFGSFVHYILHWFYNNHPKTIPLEELLAFYTQKWDELRYIDLKTKTEARLDNVHFEVGKEILANFYNTNKKNDFCEYAVLDLEKRFEIVLNDEDNETHILSGIIDRIDKLGENSFELIDYKTNKKLPGLAEVKRNPQLGLYALGIKQLWPHIKIEDLKFSLYFLKFNEKISVTKLEEDLKKVKENILGTIQIIKKTKAFNPKPTPLCNWCGFKDSCPVFKGRNIQGGPKSQEEMGKLVDQYFDLESQKTSLESQIRTLKTDIETYCKTNKVDRVYGENGYLTKTDLEEDNYDWFKVRDLLRPLGKWQKILTVNRDKLTEVLREIPEDVRLEIEKTKKINKTCKIMQATNYKELSPFQNGDVKDDKDGLKMDEEDVILEG